MRTAVRIVIRVGGNSFVEPHRIAERCSTQTIANVLIYPILTFLVSFVASL